VPAPRRRHVGGMSTAGEMESPPCRDAGVRGWRQPRGHGEGPFCFSPSMSRRISPSSVGWTGSWDRRTLPDKQRGVTGHQKLRVASPTSPNPLRRGSPMGTKEKGLPEGARPHPTGWRRVRDHSPGPWFLGGPCDTAAMPGFGSVVPLGMRDADGCPHPRRLQGRAVAVRGPPGAPKSQKIKFFPAESVGRASWGPGVAERGSGTATVQLFGGGGRCGSSLGRETEAGRG